MQAIEQYFPVVLFVLLYSVVHLLSQWLKPQSVTIQMKAIEQYFPVFLFVLLYSVVLTFDSVDETHKCDHSNDSY